MKPLTTGDEEQEKDPFINNCAQKTKKKASMYVEEHLCIYKK